MNRKSKVMLYLLIFALPVNASWRDSFESIYNSIPTFMTLSAVAACLVAGGTYYMYKYTKKRRLTKRRLAILARGKFCTLLCDIYQQRTRKRYDSIDGSVGQVCSILYGTPPTGDQEKEQACAICQSGSRSKVLFNDQEVKHMERETLMAVTGWDGEGDVKIFCRGLAVRHCSISPALHQEMFCENGMPNLLRMVCHADPYLPNFALIKGNKAMLDTEWRLYDSAVISVLIQHNSNRCLLRDIIREILPENTKSSPAEIDKARFTLALEVYGHRGEKAYRAACDDSSLSQSQKNFLDRVKKEYDQQHAVAVS